jgi:thiamine kinase-like enzyme
LIAHPNRKFIFVDVDNYEGPGSGPGHSMMCCKEYLQRPFYFCTVDCIVLDHLMCAGYDWIGVSPTNDPQAFSTAKVKWHDEDPNYCFPSAISTRLGSVQEFVNKKPNGFGNAFIGLAAINSYEYFWDKLSKSACEKESEIVAAFYNPLEINLGAVQFQWLDTGTLDNYAKTKEYFEGHQEFDFDKVGEFTYIVNGKVIKYFDDKSRVDKRVNRAKSITGVPKVVNQQGNFLYYDYEPGKTLYEATKSNVADIDHIFNWLHINLWHKREKSTASFNKSCSSFYKDKTYERFEAYKKKKGITKDSESIVNGKLCRPMEEYLEQVDWESLTHGRPVVFHGDLQFDNIILKDDGDFLLIDWRDCFADQEMYGDMYYDLAKLNGGLILPYNIIKSGAFICTKKGNEISYSYNEWVGLMKFRQKFKEWCEHMKFDREKIKLLTTLIYLNMSPLHASPFDDMVFSMAKSRFESPKWVD